MNPIACGIDFGTTNSVASVIAGDRALSFTDLTGRPHPSVIWYRGSDIVVGREAKKHLDITADGAPPGFVRSPKMRLRGEAPIFVDGRPIDRTDAVARVLQHLKADAKIPRGTAAGYDLSRAVMTIPIDFGGRERRALRQAASKAGIGIIQFVHEPVAALYAYLRSQPEYHRVLARLEGRSVLVFDWGGGTLDLTLCRIQGGTIMQIASLGDNEVGGDEFDGRLRNFLRQKHAAAYKLDDVTGFERPGMAAALLNQCERVKIELSRPDADSRDVFIGHFLKVDGAAQHLNSNVSKKELEGISATVVAQGLGRIDEILARARLTNQDIELCLATGGMVNMPAIWNGLTELFIGRVPGLENSDRIIAEGAAWIAHDNLRLRLAKPIELLVADTSGSGTYHPLVPAGLELPVENKVIPVANSGLFCVDPSEGVAVIELAKPERVGPALPSDPRKTLCVLKVPVDCTAAPFIERLVCRLQIDHDYVVSAALRSTGRGAEVKAEFHDLEFGLALPQHSESRGGQGAEGDKPGGKGPITFEGSVRSNIAQRVNVVVAADGPDIDDALWRIVPGDIVMKWRPNHFDNRTSQASTRQSEERSFYIPCSCCGRLISQIKAEGPVEECRGRRCGQGMASHFAGSGEIELRGVTPAAPPWEADRFPRTVDAEDPRPKF
jgi:molecular chaperone DnaK